MLVVKKTDLQTNPSSVAVVVAAAVAVAVAVAPSDL